MDGSHDLGYANQHAVPLAPGLVQGEAQDPNQTGQGQRDSMLGLLLQLREVDSPFSSTVT